MEITIRLLASYRQYLPDDHDEQASYRCEIPLGATVADVVQHLPIPPTDAYTVLVRGRHASMDSVLAEGDTVAIFPAVGGG